MTTGSVNPTCGDCRFWKQRVSGIGDCRRFPPTPMNGGQGVPQMSVSQWCGEHEPADVAEAPRAAGFVAPAPATPKPDKPAKKRR